MYKYVKLEKELYHLANRTFTQALESADPSAQYAGTELSSLDAYERQLKRFDIRVSGTDCDTVGKFFTTIESAVLFPEFVRRAIKQGMYDSILSELTAAVSNVNATACNGFDIDESSAYTVTTADGTELKTTAITESDLFNLEKHGRLVSVSYETLRHQRLDVFAVMLRAVGRKIAGAIAASALTVLKTAKTEVKAANGTLNYTDLAALYGAFKDYELTTVIASPENVAKILAMDEMRDRTIDAGGQIRLPFGAKLLKDSSLDDKTVIGISRNFALACFTGSDVLLETDRLIDCQLDRLAVSVRIGFQKLMSGAAAVLKIVEES